jgi:beta-lactamase class A
MRIQHNPTLRALMGLVVAAVAGTAGISPASAQPGKPQAGDQALSQRLAAIAKTAGGTVGAAAIHVETGRTVEVQGRRPLPLYSVFKLPVAIVILKEVEAGRLKLDQKVHVTKAEVVQGTPETMVLWAAAPLERTLREMLELSLAKSDNTSADKLLELAGGAGAVTRKLSALGIGGITIRRSVSEFFRDFTAEPGKAHPNTASPLDLARLLARLQKGEILGPASREVLFGFMGAATTGVHRLRGALPEGTPVAHKTGSGLRDSASNDVGIITLPDGKHVATAVLVCGWKRPVAAQEKVIADIARAVYDANVSAR